MPQTSSAQHRSKNAAAQPHFYHSPRRGGVRQMHGIWRWGGSDCASLCAACTALLLFAFPAQAEDASAALTRLLASFTTLTADFTQQTPGADAEAQQGRLWLQGPNKFRIESVPPLSQTVVSDGESLWRYDLDLEQVVITRLDSDAAEVPVLLLAANADLLARRFHVESYGKGAQQAFVLTPKADEPLQALTLVFSDGRPKSLTLEAMPQGRTQIDFSAVHLDPPLPKAIFTLESPPTTDIIDSR